MVMLIALLTLSANAFSANIVRPWRSTTEIVQPGETFEVWFNAVAGQTINQVQLEGERTHQRLELHPASHPGGQ